MGFLTVQRGNTALKKLRLLSVCLTLSACAGDPFLVVDESPALTTFDGLHPVVTDIFDRVWVRTPLDLSRFDKLLIEEAKSFYRYVPDDSPGKTMQIVISAENREAFETRLSASIRDSLSSSSKFQLVNSPGSDVLTFWGTVVDVNVRTTGNRTNIGEFILLIELRDSVTTDTLLRLVHPYELRLDDRDPIGNLEEVDRIALEISSLLRQKLDELFTEFAT